MPKAFDRPVERSSPRGTRARRGRVRRRAVRPRTSRTVLARRLGELASTPCRRRRGSRGGPRRARSRRRRWSRSATVKRREHRVPAHAHVRDRDRACRRPGRGGAGPSARRRSASAEDDAEVEAVDDPLGDDGARRGGERDRPTPDARRWPGPACGSCTAGRTRRCGTAGAGWPRSRRTRPRRGASWARRRSSAGGSATARCGTSAKTPSVTKYAGTVHQRTCSKSPPSGTSFRPPLWTVKTMPQRDDERRGELDARGAAGTPEASCADPRLKLFECVPDPRDVAARISTRRLARSKRSSTGFGARSVAGSRTLLTSTRTPPSRIIDWMPGWPRLEVPLVGHGQHHRIETHKLLDGRRA